LCVVFGSSPLLEWPDEISKILPHVVPGVADPLYRWSFSNSVLYVVFFNMRAEAHYERLDFPVWLLRHSVILL
jgi:hypothetical protein